MTAIFSGSICKIKRNISWKPFGLTSFYEFQNLAKKSKRPKATWPTAYETLVLTCLDLHTVLSEKQGHAMQKEKRFYGMFPETNSDSKTY